MLYKECHRKEPYIKHDCHDVNIEMYLIKNKSFDSLPPSEHNYQRREKNTQLAMDIFDLNLDDWIRNTVQFQTIMLKRCTGSQYNKLMTREEITQIQIDRAREGVYLEKLIPGLCSFYSASRAQVIHDTNEGVYGFKDCYNCDGEPINPCSKYRIPKKK